MTHVSCVSCETDGYRRIKKVSLNYVESMKVGDQPGRYRKEASGDDSFYGSYHALHILDMFNELAPIPSDKLDVWAERFFDNQSKQGFFAADAQVRKQSLTLADMEPYWHFTRGNLWSLRLLNRKPPYPLQFLEPLLEPRQLYRWVKHYDWKNPWAAANQVLAGATALFAARDWFGAANVDQAMEQGMYPALEELLDEKTGYWGTQFGAGPLDGLFGAIHVTPIYFTQKWPLRAVDRNIDATLGCQRDDGSFWPGGSDCPDFDGAYMMANLAELTDYRREDLNAAARHYLEHALQHEDPHGVGWLLHRRDSKPSDWRPRPHWIWKPGAEEVVAEYRDEDPNRTHIMLGSWFYPLSIALVAHQLGDTGYEGPYRLNPGSLHQCNVFSFNLPTTETVS